MSKFNRRACCKNCHFLVFNPDCPNEFYGGHTDAIREEHEMCFGSAVIPLDDRCKYIDDFMRIAAIAAEKKKLIPTNIKCEHNVWIPKVSHAHHINNNFFLCERSNCFFFPFHEGMSVDTAIELEKRYKEKEHINTSLNQSKHANWVAWFLAFVFAVLSAAISLWCHYHPIEKIVP